MGATVELNSQNFKETVDRQGTVFIDWWAPWCGPCRSFAPIYESTAEKNSDITFAKVNTEDHPDLSGMFQIQAIPTLMVFRDGILLFAEAGALPASALESLIEQVKALDMDQVRKEIAAREPGTTAPES
ncbi:MAG TPA: thioredoxin [Myxococcaceae bacterium]|nr:thioredoxin [Myxococcaceae bacterium]